MRKAIFAVLQLCGVIVLAVYVCIASISVNRNRSRIFMVFSSFTADTLDSTPSDASHHHESTTDRGMIAVMAVVNAICDMVNVDDAASRIRMAVTCDRFHHNISKRL